MRLLPLLASADGGKATPHRRFGPDHRVHVVGGKLTALDHGSSHRGGQAAPPCRTAQSVVLRHVFTAAASVGQWIGFSTLAWPSAQTVKPSAEVRWGWSSQ